MENKISKKQDKKTKVIETLNTLPEEFHIEELIEKLIFISKEVIVLRVVHSARLLDLED